MKYFRTVKDEKKEKEKKVEKDNKDSLKTFIFKFYISQIKYELKVFINDYMSFLEIDKINNKRGYNGESK